MIVRLRQISATVPDKGTGRADDVVLREVLEEFRWIDASADAAECDRRHAWLSTTVIPSTDRFSMRRDRHGFLIAFGQFGNRLHPLGWTIERGRSCSYRGLNQRRPTLIARVRRSLAGAFGLSRPNAQISAAE